MAKEEPIQLEGIVKESLPSAKFIVEIAGGNTVLAHVSGKMRTHFIKIFPGDKVSIEMSPYDLTKARITYREK